LYVASEGPEIEVESGVENAVWENGDKFRVKEVKCENQGNSFPQSSVEKLVEKRASETANGGNLRTCSTLHTFCSKFVYSKNLIFFRHLR
jgi:hypothetical protein